MQTEPISRFALGCVIARLKAILREEIAALDLDPECFDIDAMLSYPQIVNGLIRCEYNRMREEGICAEAIYEELHVKFGHTVGTIKQVVQKNR